jgi:hypothetical protein
LGASQGINSSDRRLSTNNFHLLPAPFPILCPVR